MCRLQPHTFHRQSAVGRLTPQLITLNTLVSLDRIELSISCIQSKRITTFPTDWWTVRDLNPRPSRCKRGALPLS